MLPTPSLDLDLPLEVDDEYWENDDPEMAFRQPEGKPALVSAFVKWIKLSHIIAYALKTLVSASRISCPEYLISQEVHCICSTLPTSRTCQPVLWGHNFWSRRLRN